MLGIKLEKGRAAGQMPTGKKSKMESSVDISTVNKDVNSGENNDLNNLIYIFFLIM